jgi:hypothetical protein
MKPRQIGPRPARPWRIVLGIFLILLFVTGSQTIDASDIGAAVGSLVAILIGAAIFLGGGIWLISSGLARR